MRLDGGEHFAFVRLPRLISLDKYVGLLGVVAHLGLERRGGGACPQPDAVSQD
jgi:hypothetical protein